MRWFEAITRAESEGERYVIATVMAVTGSAPRDPGGKMVVTATDADDSIGGGQLEALVIDRARELLTRQEPAAEIHHFPLAAAARQCCGGSVTVLLEPMATCRLDVCVFGAGHVGARVARLLGDLPVRLTVADPRTGHPAAIGGHARRLQDVDTALTELRPDSHVLVLTHDHLLDYHIVAAVLRHGRWASVGLIGSRTKWQRFRARLLQDGLPAGDVDRVRCPVGFTGVGGKEPMAIAVAIVGELLTLAPTAGARTDGLTWRQIKETLVQTPSPGEARAAAADRPPAAAAGRDPARRRLP